MNREHRNVSVGHFFDSLTDDYTATIERCFPRYREMLWALLDYLPTFQWSSILELGAGTGNLTFLLTERFSNAKITTVDVSGKSLDVCRERLGDQVEYLEKDFRDLDFPSSSFDLIVSSISIHHLTSPEKQTLFGNACRWLSPGGVFAWVDQHAGATEEIYRRHVENWKQLSMSAGSTVEEWEMWMQHQKQHDHHDTLLDQVQWLREAGFSVIDCPWRYLLWTVLQARKAS